MILLRAYTHHHHETFTTHHVMVLYVEATDNQLTLEACRGPRNDFTAERAEVMGVLGLEDDEDLFRDLMTDRNFIGEEL